MIFGHQRFKKDCFAHFCFKNLGDFFYNRRLQLHYFNAHKCEYLLFKPAAPVLVTNVDGKKERPAGHNDRK